MAEVIVQFDEPFRAPDGRIFVAQVCGQSVSDGLWEGWIQFMPENGDDPVKTRRETEQLSRGDLRYWAAGLTRQKVFDLLAYVLRMRAPTPSWRKGEPIMFQEPHKDETLTFSSATLTRQAATINPFVLFKQGEHVLRYYLQSMSAAQLKEIVAIYEIPERESVLSARTFEESLIEQIVAGAQQGVEGKRRSRRKGEQLL